MPSPKTPLKAQTRAGLAGFALGLLALAAALWALRPNDVNPADLGLSPARILRPAHSLEVTQALPLRVPLDPRRVALGRQLFHDPRLSVDDTVSCASCHALAAGGVDRRARSVGVKGGVGGINAPTVLNSGLNMVQFWDGRATTLEDQIDGPVQHPLEMGSTWPTALAKLQADPRYPAQFAALYPAGITVETVKDAIATFERALVTPNSAFDRFLRGDAQAIEAPAQRGWALFQSYGCAACHQGVNLGGNMYEKMGLMGDYFADRGQITLADLGRFNLTHDPQNLHEFRVPSLRNVALTPPYFHDGSEQTLEQAILVMARYQLGRVVPATDVSDIAAFLRSLSAELPAEAQP